jgi:hypothetical protein
MSDTQSSASAVFFRDGQSNEFVAALSVDADTFLPAPAGESVRIDIYALGQDALGLEFLFRFFDSLQPIFPRARHFVAVFKDSQKGRVIVFPKPSDADSPQLGHAMAL